MALVVFGIFFWGVPVFAATEGLTIDGYVVETKDRWVSLGITGPPGTEQMKISNDPDLSGARFEPYRTSKEWQIDYGTGLHTVYVRFMLRGGATTKTYSRTITLKPPAIGVEIGLEGENPTDSRFVPIAATTTLGIDAYRVGTQPDLSGVDFIPIFRTSTHFAAVVTSGSGPKKIYVDFKDASGKVVQYTLSVVYNQPARYIPEGTLLKASGPGIYYFGIDGLLHPFVDEASYRSWFPNFDNITYVSDVKLSQYQFGNPVCVRQGTWLLRFSGLPTVYQVRPGCVIEPLRSETEAFLLYGSAWNKRVKVLDPLYRSQYTALSFGIGDEDKKIVDDDEDGLDEDVELSYGAKDTSWDSDGDGVSDYEEIVYWFSDPTKSDTDGDGVKDGAEIRSGRSPVGPATFAGLPSGTYAHAWGAVIRQPRSINLLYVLNRTTTRSLGSTVFQNSFTTNRFQSQFITTPPFTFFYPSTNGSVTPNTPFYSQPFVYTASGQFVQL